jgi:hypothetical protein
MANIVHQLHRLIVMANNLLLTPSSHCDGQHSSPASSLHLHYSESINGESDELENCENSPCQQSSPTPSFQISEAGSAEFVYVLEAYIKCVNNQFVCLNQ